MIQRLSLIVIFMAMSPLPFVVPARADFTEVAGEARVDDGGLGAGVACGDYDGDGHLDIYVSRSGWGEFIDDLDTLYHNNGDGTFTKEGKFKHAEMGFDPVFVDYDNDGDLDLCLCTNQGVFLHRNQGGGIFREVREEAGLRRGGFIYTPAFGDYDKDGHLDIYLGISGQNSFYRSNRDGTFSDVTQEAGVGGHRNSFSVHFFDYDNDGDLDIYVLNGGGRFIGADNRDLLYRNNGDGTFTEIGQKAEVNHMGDGRCVISGDYDNDGDLDLFVGGDGYTALYRNNNDGTFTDVTKEAGLNKSTQVEAACFGDYDNDGYLDLYVSRWWGVNSLYHNNGDGTFKDEAKKNGVVIEGLRSTGTILFDYDNDGDLDIFVATYGGTQKLYRNNGTNHHWLQVKLEGVKSNRDGIGARVQVELGELKMMREISSGSFRVHPGFIAHFGMADHEKADKVEVYWPSGEVDVLYDIPADQLITIKEGETDSSVQPHDKRYAVWGKIKRNQLLQNYPNPFNPETWIPYRLAQSGEVKIQVFNMRGQLVRDLSPGYQPAGSYLNRCRAAYWDGRNEVGERVSSGTYFYRLQTNGFIATRRMVIVK